MRRDRVWNTGHEDLFERIVVFDEWVSSGDVAKCWVGKCYVF